MTKRISLLLALAIAAVSLTACGEGLPSGSVAKVGDIAIGRKVFDHWYELAYKSQQALFNPKSKKALKVPKPTSKQGKMITQQIMGQLISDAEILQEAQEMGISVSQNKVDKQTDKTFKQGKQQSFGGSQKKLDAFMKKTGLAREDIAYQAKINLLKEAIGKKVVEGKENVSDEEVKKNYEKNKEQQYTTPKRYDLLVVLTKNEDEANSAKERIDGGESFADVAKEMSKDTFSKEQGGKLPGVTEGQNGPKFDEALKSAKSGEVVGPVKTPLGYYVFEVTKSHEAKETPFKDAEKQIKQQLKMQKTSEAGQKFKENFDKKWRAATICAKDFKVPELCGNAPKPKPQQGFPGQMPQQGGQAPQQGGQAPQQGGQAPPPPSGPEK